MATGQLTSRTPDCKPSEQEMKLLAAAKTAFDKADADSGGTLDREEVRDVLLELGCEVHAETDNEYFLEAFARFDVDDSGALEYVLSYALSRPTLACRWPNRTDEYDCFCLSSRVVRCNQARLGCKPINSLAPGALVVGRVHCFHLWALLQVR